MFKDLSFTLYRGSRFLVYREKFGAISEYPIWLLIDNHGYMYMHKYFIGLCWVVITDWKNDRHLC